jgi:hypothetical protein
MIPYQVLSELLSGQRYEHTAICRTLARIMYVEKDCLFSA